MLHIAHLSMCSEWISTLPLTLFWHCLLEERKEATKMPILVGLTGRADAISLPSVSIIPHSIPSVTLFYRWETVVIAKSTQEVRRLGRQFSLAEGSTLVYRQHIFLGKNEETEPHRSLFPTLALGSSPDKWYKNGKEVSWLLSPLKWVDSEAHSYSFSMCHLLGNRNHLV